MPILVVLEHDGTNLRAGSRSAISAARSLADNLNSDLELLLLGDHIEQLAQQVAEYGTTIVAESPLLEHASAVPYARIIADLCREHSHDVVVAASTTFAKDILPRAAALLGAAMASDVIEVSCKDNELMVRRPVYAGAAIASVRLVGRPAVVTVRPSAFSPALPSAQRHACRRWTVNADTLSKSVEHVRLESRNSSRPDVGEARVVVSGGRAFRSPEEFETYVGGLADALGGATGCTRALVDSGIAPNEWQVGQTGRVVAPELYVALGVSGAIQHIAGMKNSRVIVAINQDADAPIFGIANYGLVGDVREIVPELIERLLDLR